MNGDGNDGIEIIDYYHETNYVGLELDEDANIDSINKYIKIKYILLKKYFNLFTIYIYHIHYSKIYI